MAIGDNTMWRRAAHRVCAVSPPLMFLCLFFAMSVEKVSGEVLESLRALANRSPVGDPTVVAADLIEGPKGVAKGDFGGDSRPDLAVSNLDGSMSLLFYAIDGGLPGGIAPAEPVHIQTGARTLRGIAAGDLSGDGKDDLVTAAPFEGELHLWIQGSGAAPLPIEAWVGVRNVAIGDFDGNGQNEIVAVGPNGGLRIYSGNPTSGFAEQYHFPEMSVQSDPSGDGFPGPHYSVTTFRRPASDRDSIAVGHASSTVVWVLDATANSAIAISEEVRIEGAPHAIVVENLGPDAQSASLIVASKETNAVQVMSPSSTNSEFGSAKPQTISLPNGPRAVGVLNLGGTTGFHLAVALRDSDKVVIFEQREGVFRFVSEEGVGRSPREMVVADLNGDATADLATINRVSEDVSVLLNDPAEDGILRPPGLVSVAGAIVDVRIADVSDDPVADILLLMRAGDLFVIPGGEDGPKQNISKYSIGGRSAVASQLTVGDFDKNGRTDVAVADLSRGCVEVLLGEGDGLRAGPTVELPVEERGKLLSIEAADFDGNRTVDLAVGYADSRLAFLSGQGDGSFVFDGAYGFANGARRLAVADFDEDGAPDIAGTDYFGETMLLQNTGGRGFSFTKREIAPAAGDLYGAGALRVFQRDGEEDELPPRVLMGTNRGIYLFDNVFSETRRIGSLPAEAIGGMAFGDFDQEFGRDIAYTCLPQQCLVIASGSEDGEFTETLRVSVPASRFLVKGDINDDGEDDLIGAGDNLWFALSGSETPGNTARIQLPDERLEAGTPVINEILAKNDSIRLPNGIDGSPDFVEIFNGSSERAVLAGWTLRLTKLTVEGVEEETWDYPIPSSAVMESASHFVIPLGESHTGFPLPRKRGILVLMDETGREVDSVEYADQEADVSLARVRDGVDRFQLNPSPDPGAANFGIGGISTVAPPQVELHRIDYDSLQAGSPWHVTVRSSDSVGIAAMSVVYRVAGGGRCLAACGAGCTMMESMAMGLLEMASMAG